MSRQYRFTREEIATELQRCGYPLTTDEEVARFERDLAALYGDGKFSCSDYADESNYSASDKFYDLPPPSRDDIDFSKYYTKSQTSDCLLGPKKNDEKHYPKSLIKNPPKLQPISSQSAPNSARVEKKLTSASFNTTTKRKVLRKSDDGSSYIDELMFGRKLPPVTKPKTGHLPLVIDDGIEDHDLPPLSFDYNAKDQIEDKISRLTLVSEGPDSPIMRRSYDVANSTKSRTTLSKKQDGHDDHSPLRLSDRDNRQVSGKANGSNNKTAASSSGDSGFLPSVITRPVQASVKSTKRVMAQDPVTRYAEYAKGWRNQRAPGEKAHKELRWQIRGQMLARDETTLMSQQKRRPVPPATTASKPNAYIVPTEKKRQALRWAIRSALAAGRPPPTSTRYVNRAFLTG